VCIKKHGSCNFHYGHNILWILMGQSAGSMFDMHKVMCEKLFGRSSVHQKTVFEGYAKTYLQKTLLQKCDDFLLLNERIDVEKNGRFVFSASILTRTGVACMDKGHGFDKNTASEISYLFLQPVLLILIYLYIYAYIVCTDRVCS
jgi:hypothetical protein